jgi:hypothetical protein
VLILLARASLRSMITMINSSGRHGNTISLTLYAQFELVSITADGNKMIISHYQAEYLADREHFRMASHFGALQFVKCLDRLGLKSKEFRNPFEISNQSGFTRTILVSICSCSN